MNSEPYQDNNTHQSLGHNESDWYHAQRQVLQTNEEKHEISGNPGEKNNKGRKREKKKNL